MIVVVVFLVMVVLPLYVTEDSSDDDDDDVHLSFLCRRLCHAAAVAGFLCVVAVQRRM